MDATFGLTVFVEVAGRDEVFAGGVFGVAWRASSAAGDDTRAAASARRSALPNEIVRVLVTGRQ